MEKVYKKIFGKLIRHYRKSNGFSQEKMSNICHMSQSYYSKFELGDYTISNEAIQSIIETLKLNINTNEEFVRDCENKFNSLYKYIIEYNDLSAEITQNLIHDDKENILNSLCFFKYYLYNFVYLEYICQNNEMVLINDVNFLLDNINYYSKSDLCILYDYIGLYFQHEKDLEKATYYYKLAIGTNTTGLPLAMTLYHSVKVLVFQDRFVDAIDYIRKALLIFESFKIEKRIVACYMSMSNIYANINQRDDALKYLFKIINIASNNETKVYALHNILRIYICDGDDEKALSLLNTIEKDYIVYYDLLFYKVVLKYFLDKHDKNNFDKWYLLSKECKNREPLKESIIELMNSVVNNHKAINTNYEKCISYIKLPYDKEDFDDINLLVKDYK